jgi:hypothetical protein
MDSKESPYAAKPRAGTSPTRSRPAAAAGPAKTSTIASVKVLALSYALSASSHTASNSCRQDAVAGLVDRSIHLLPAALQLPCRTGPRPRCASRRPLPSPHRPHPSHPPASQHLLPRLGRRRTPRLQQRQGPSPLLPPAAAQPRNQLWGLAPSQRRPPLRVQVKLPLSTAHETRFLRQIRHPYRARAAPNGCAPGFLVCRQGWRQVRSSGQGQDRSRASGSCGARSCGCRCGCCPGRRGGGRGPQGRVSVGHPLLTIPKNATDMCTRALCRVALGVAAGASRVKRGRKQPQTLTQSRMGAGPVPSIRQSARHDAGWPVPRVRRLCCDTTT